MGDRWEGVRGTFTPSVLAALVAAVPLAALAVVAAAGDPGGDRWGGNLIIGAACVPSVWAVLRCAWDRDAGLMGGLRAVLVAPPWPRCCARWS